MALSQSTGDIRARPTAGIAMCVFNGIRFLQEQLQSISLQTELPNCLAIIDDGSTDGSWELLKTWKATAPFQVRLLRNAVTLGVVRNFEKAISLLADDVIFLADQDDVWHPTKIEIFLDYFHADPEIGLVHSDAFLIDSRGLPLNRRLFNTLLITADEKANIGAGSAYRVFAKRNLVTGAASAFRRSLLRRATPFSARWVHDEWLAFTAALVSKIVLINNVTMSYRLHDENTIGLPIPNLQWRICVVVNAFLKPIAERQQIQARRLYEMYSHALHLHAPEYMQLYLLAAARHAEFRSNLPRSYLLRAKRILVERRTGQYHEWSNGKLSILRDIVLGS